MKRISKHFGLTKADVIALDGFTRRMTELCELNEEIKSFMFLDAEQTYIQPAVDSLSRQFQEVYNKDRGSLLNGYQCYLRDAKKQIDLEVRRCQALGIPLGLKLIRGAYIEEERRIAA